MNNAKEDASYRQSHSAPGYGQRYDANYAVGYYAAIFREVESRILEKIFLDLRGGRDSLLDFACGTGRITRLAEPHFRRVVGVDVSEAMLQRARAAGNQDYVMQDLTRHPLNEKFSVITAFRFFLNAEPALRRDALGAIKNHLAPGGRLVCNIHMNSRSVMGLIYRLTKWIPFVPKHNTLSIDQFEKLLQEGGFVIDRVSWYGVTPRPGRLFPRLLDRWLGPIERVFSTLGLQGRFSHSFIVVARSTEDGSQ
jgi:SAM-dependent methyltransferase